LGLRDGTKGFLKFEDCGMGESVKKLREGQYVTVLVKTIV
jgi:hypothetical protein